MPGFPTGCAIAPLPFATQAVVKFGVRLDVKAVGRAEEGKARWVRSGPAEVRSAVYRLGLKGQDG